MGPFELKDMFADLGVKPMHVRVLTHELGSLGGIVADAAGGVAQDGVRAATQAGNATAGAADKVVSAAGKGMSAAGKVVGRSGVAGDVGSAAAQAGNAAGAAAGDVDVAAAAGVAVAGLGAIAGVFDPNVALAAMVSMGHLAEAFPLLGPLGAAIGGVALAARTAAVNKVAVASMAKKVHEVALIIEELFTTAKATGIKSAALDAETAHLVDLIEKAQKFCEEFSKRGFLSKMLRGFWDEKTTHQLDLDITSCVQNIGVTLNVHQARMSQVNFDSLRALAVAARSESADDVARLSGASAAEARAEIASCAEEIAAMRREMASNFDSVKGNQASMLQHQAEMKALLVSIASGQAPGGLAGSEAKALDDEAERSFDRMLHASGSAHLGEIPVGKFVPLFEAHFCDGADLDPEIARRFVDKLDRDDGGSVDMVEWTKFHAQLKNSGDTGPSFVEKWLTASDNSTTVELRIIVPPDVSAGQSFLINHQGAMCSITCPPGAFPGTTLTIRVPRPPKAGNGQGQTSAPPNSIPPAPNPQPQTLRVQVPPGVLPGHTFYVTHNGQRLAVVCPQGAFPGAVIHIQAPAGATFRPSERINFSGNGMAEAVAADTTGDGHFDTFTPLLQHFCPPFGSVTLDFNGDGQADCVGIDTTGNGVVDKLRPLRPYHAALSPQPPQPHHHHHQQQQQQQPQSPGPSVLTFIVPQGAFPGSTVSLTNPKTGQPVQVVIPPGACPGTQIKVPI